MTLENLKSKLETRVYDAMIDLHDDMSKRIFKELKDSQGGSPKPYSTKPLWMSVINYPQGVKKAGRPSKTGKTLYLEGGYSQLKSEINRPPLELSGTLAGDFRNALRTVKKINAFEYHFVVDSENLNKIEGHFTEFFKPSEEEIDNLKNSLGAKVTK